MIAATATGLLPAWPAVAGNVSEKEVAALMGVLVVALVAPAHVGADLQVAGDLPTRVVVGWSYQFPLDGRLFDEHSRHRVVAGGDLLIRGGVDGRGRFGYRYSTHWLFGGAGVSVTGKGPAFSPEAGVKFAPLHLLVRGDIEPDFQRVRGVTIALGWSLL
jgi:hypothetical protein